MYRTAHVADTPTSRPLIRQRRAHESILLANCMQHQRRICTLWTGASVRPHSVYALSSVRRVTTERKKSQESSNLVWKRSLPTALVTGDAIHYAQVNAKESCVAAS